MAISLHIFEPQDEGKKWEIHLRDNEINVATLFVDEVTVVDKHTIVCTQEELIDNSHKLNALELKIEESGVVL